LDIAVVVFTWPDEPAAGLDGLRHHVVDQAVFLPEFGGVEGGLVLRQIERENKGGRRRKAACLSKISWNMSLNLPLYLLRMVFFVDMYCTLRTMLITTA
jgi:hypothetical protein